VERGWATSELLMFRNHGATSDLWLPNARREAWFEGAFSIVCLTSAVVGIRYAIHSYVGGVHPNVDFRTVNVRRDPLFLLTFDDLFDLPAIFRTS
jgi:hypothetical protein